MTPQNQSDSSSDDITTTSTESTVTPAEPSATDTDSAAQDAPEQTESSTVETPGAKPTSLHDIIKSVVNESPAAASPSKEPAKESEAPKAKGSDTPDHPAPSGDEDVSEKHDPADDESLPFHKYPRWQEVIKERNSFREQATAFRDKATQFDAISDFMAESRLSPDDVNRALEISAAVKSDPTKALAMLSETMTFLRGITGEDLPDDVNQLVEDGEMTEAAARELARARAKVALQEQRNRENDELNQRHQVASTQQQIVGAVENWEQRIAASDPDYQAKRALVLDNIRLAHLATPARNAQEALAIAEAAHAKATQTVKGFRPKPTEIKAPASGQSLPAATHQPKTLGDVIRRAVR